MRFFFLILISYNHFVQASIICQDLDHNYYKFDELDNNNYSLEILDPLGKKQDDSIELRFVSEHSSPYQSILAYGFIEGNKFIIHADGIKNEGAFTGTLFKFGNQPIDTEVCCEKSLDINEFQGCFLGM